MKSKAVTIVIPVYNGWPYLRKCLASLVRFGKGAGKIIIVNDASTDKTLEAKVLRAIRGKRRFHYYRNETNLGFVGTCNRAVFELDGTKNDILLLNSDTEVTKGFLEEMVACLYDFEKHAVCSPRSNHATIMTIPPVYTGDRKRFESVSYLCWQKLAPAYRRYDVVPTGVGFCMLIRRKIIENFGLFDQKYERGYNEENDFCSRINRYGYSVIRANRAYVYHFEAQSFGMEREHLESSNRRVLDERYPEYAPAVGNYVDWRRDAVDHFADVLGGCYPRKRILFDLLRLVPVYNGTNEQALGNLRGAYPILSKRYDVTIAINRQADGILGVSSQFPNVIVGSALKPELHFDVAYVPHQLFEYDQLFRLNKVAVRFVVNLQDIIALRSNYLQQIVYENVCRHVMKWSDAIVSVSKFSIGDLKHYFGERIFESSVRSARAILLAKNDRSKEPDSLDASLLPQDFVLLIGNKFHHKAITRALEEIDARYPVVVVGDIPDGELGSNVQIYRSGNLSEEFIESLYRRCRVLLFPSQYEGFGLPVLNAMIYGKAVILYRCAVNEELLANFRHSNPIHFFSLFSELRSILTDVFETPDERACPTTLSRTWRDAGRETAEAIESVLSQDVNIERLSERFFELKVLEHYGAVCGIMGSISARSVPEAVERLKALESSLSYRVGRLMTFPLRIVYDLITQQLLARMGRSSSSLTRRLHILGTRLLHRK